MILPMLLSAIHHCTQIVPAVVVLSQRSAINIQWGLLNVSLRHRFGCRRLSCCCNRTWRGFTFLPLFVRWARQSTSIRLHMVCEKTYVHRRACTDKRTRKKTKWSWLHSGYASVWLPPWALRLCLAVRLCLPCCRSSGTILPFVGFPWETKTPPPLPLTWHFFWSICLAWS